MDIKDIYQAVRPLKNRMHLNKAIFTMLVALAAAGGVSLLLSIVAIFLPVPFQSAVIVTAYILAVLTGIIVSLFLRPANLPVIRTADSLGLKERLVTAYELRNDKTPLAGVQREDALKSVAKVDFRSLYPIRFPVRTGVAAVGLVALILITSIIPSPAKDKAKLVENVVKEIKKQAEKLAQEQKDINKKNKVSQATLKDINKKMEQLLKELKKSDTSEKALKALSKTKNELTDLKKKGLQDELNKLGDHLKDNPLSKELSEALKNGNMDDIKQKLEQLKQQMNNASGEEKKKLSEQLKKAAQDSKSQELSKSLENLAQSAASGNPNAVSSNISNLQQMLSQMSQDGQSSGLQQADNQAINQLSDSISDAKYSISDQAGEGSMTAQADEPGQNGQSGDGGEGQDGNGQGDGNGDGGQDGDGSGNGSGEGGKGKGGGSGVGDGSSNGDAGYSGEESGGGSRQQPGKKEIKDYESVFVPERLGGDTKSSQVKGRKNNSGQSQWSEASNIPIEKGNTVPYDQVLGEYKSEAMSGLQDSPIPPVMKDIVRDYFTSLE